MNLSSSYEIGNRTVNSSSKYVRGTIQGTGNKDILHVYRIINYAEYLRLN